MNRYQHLASNGAQVGRAAVGRWTAALAIAGMAATASGALAADYPMPKNLGSPQTLGKNIQRTMTLLATSTPKHRNTVRILFYGQSITEQPWAQMVAADLKRRFPNADLLIENRALGGFSSQLLHRTAETDLFPFYPDLMIFHVYGSHIDYEDVIRKTRQRTTAEILIQTDHLNTDADLDEITDPAKLYPDGKIWGAFFNYSFLPHMASLYQTGIEDRRNLWKQYLRDYKVHAPDLLADGVHPNAYGNFLMAQFDSAYLVKRADVKIDPMQCDTVMTHKVGRDVKVKEGKLTLTFKGNRVDLVASGKPGAAQILIDGKKPSEIPSLYSFTRALGKPGGKWPLILKLAYEKPLQLEDWTMQVTKDPAVEKRYTFTLIGSKTGADGEGSSDKPFTSTSGRIVIAPDDWNVEYSLALAGTKPPPDKFEIRWSVVPFFQDQYTAPTAVDPTVESVATVAQGLPNGPHTLEISGETAAISAIRIYKPPLAEIRVSSAPINIVPIGDSITQGGRMDRPEFSYRYPLYYLLKQDGYNVRYVGSLKGGLNAGFKWPARDGVEFDLNHEGHYGYSTATVRDHLAEWSKSWSAAPDVALIHLGTNDQGSKDFQADIIRPLKDIVAMLRAKNPHVAVFVAHLDFNGGAALQIRPVVEAMANELNTATSPVVTVPMYDGWHDNPDDPKSDTFDWAHPNEQGQAKMAHKWLDAMKPYIYHLELARDLPKASRK